MMQERSSWAVGWVLFAAVTMMMIGAFQAINGLVAIFNDEFFVVGEEWVFDLDVTQWGWIHLIFGTLLAIAGLGLLSGNVVSQVLAVILAVLSAIANFMWLPYYPIWSAVVIALDIAVIWAITLHGNEVADG